MSGLYRHITQLQLDWEGIYEAATTVDEQGWTLEMEIPFKTLSFDPDSDTWGMNFFRVIAHRDERIGWVSRNRGQNPSIVGRAVGFTGLEQGLGLDIVPSVSLVRSRSFSPPSNYSDTDPSVDLYYKITPALNATLTLNTDFAATEVDDRQVNLTRFNLFFPEKRGFFLQDLDIFEFGRIGAQTSVFGGGGNTAVSRPDRENGRPFFSRNIGLSATGEPVALNYGGKLSGRVGRWNVGALGIRQDGFLDVEPTDILVGRVTANVLAESSIGMMVTSGDPNSNIDNTLVGADFQYQNTQLAGGRTLKAEAWFQQTHTDGIDGDDSASGLGLRMPNSTGFRWGLAVRELEQNFLPALGFVSRTGIRSDTLDLGYTYRPRSGYLRSIFTGVDAQRIERLAGGLDSQVVSWRLIELQSRVSDSMGLRYIASKEVLVEPFEISSGVEIPPGE